jgi:hypothetical protein
MSPTPPFRRAAPRVSGSNLVLSKPLQFPGSAEADRSRLPAGYNSTRFTGVLQDSLLPNVAGLLAVVSNPVLNRLRLELERVEQVTRHIGGLDEDTKRTVQHTKAHWAAAWRRWAIDDLGDAVAQSRLTYVIYRGEVFRHRLFLDQGGRHLLAVQPQEPASKLRYTRLSGTTSLTDLYGPFARLSDDPRG